MTDCVCGHPDTSHHVIANDPTVQACNVAPCTCTAFQPACWRCLAAIGLNDPVCKACGAARIYGNPSAGMP